MPPRRLRYEIRKKLRILSGRVPRSERPGELRCCATAAARARAAVGTPQVGDSRRYSETLYRRRGRRLPPADVIIIQRDRAPPPPSTGKSDVCPANDDCSLNTERAGSCIVEGFPDVTISNAPIGFRRSRATYGEQSNFKKHKLPASRRAPPAAFASPRDKSKRNIAFSRRRQR
ncbi:hypothetical protein EVAR_32589_1 [Eumeta japonica]|uniref:Uncharacterized protein n=1 Tax=Eumeta variegata TaxID=151549 RepID=A0A4C1VPR9_EUMVA|nr:hypothetical protein EVAR_32589_1 [Eumeta japonica]